MEEDICGESMISVGGCKLIKALLVVLSVDLAVLVVLVICFNGECSTFEMVRVVRGVMLVAVVAFIAALSLPFNMFMFSVNCIARSRRRNTSSIVACSTAAMAASCSILSSVALIRVPMISMALP